MFLLQKPETSFKILTLLMTNDYVTTLKCPFMPSPAKQTTDQPFNP